MPSREAETRNQIVQLMRAGGYWERLMSAGPELARVQQFLSILAGDSPPVKGGVSQRPWLMPLFPGLNHIPIRPREDAEWVRALEGAWQQIRDEAVAAAGSFLSYNDYSEDRPWTVYPLFYMGGATPLAARCPQTVAVLESLPRACLRYPWGDAVFSAQAPGSHLTAHCSVDNLRLRCHLGLVVPRSCRLRVAHLVRGWEEGQTLFFEDSFEHEVWNRGEQTRIVLIVDLWHPDLTEIEIEALTAAFRPAMMRDLFAGFRLPAHAQRLRHALSTQFEREDDDDLLRRYWNLEGAGAKRPSAPSAVGSTP